MLNLHNAFFVVCLGLFVWQVIIILISFAEKETSIAIKSEDTAIQNKILPCLTFCPKSGYKNLFQYHASNISYKTDTFGPEEIFTNETQSDFRNESKWLVKELHTVGLGRCTMACFKLNMSYMDLVNGPKIVLNSSRSYQVKKSCFQVLVTFHKESGSMCNFERLTKCY